MNRIEEYLHENKLKQFNSIISYLILQNDTMEKRFVSKLVILNRQWVNIDVFVYEFYTVHSNRAVLDISFNKSDKKLIDTSFVFIDFNQLKRIYKKFNNIGSLYNYFKVATIY